MGWFDSAWNWLSSKVGGWIHDSSILEFLKGISTLLIVLAVIGIIGFWWWLLHHGLNRGGDH